MTITATRPVTTKAANDAGITSKFLDARIRILEREKARLVQENQQLRERLASHRKLWSVEALAKLEPSAAQAAHEALSLAAISPTNRHTNGYLKDLDFARELLKRKTGPKHAGVQR